MKKSIIAMVLISLTACGSSPSQDTAPPPQTTPTKATTTSSSTGGVEVYECTINASKTKGWVPERLFITFTNQKAVMMVSTSYDYDMSRVKTLRFNDDFKEVKYRGRFVDASNQSVATTHTITIMPSKDNKIIYNFKFDHYSNGYSGRGSCNRS